MKKYIPYIAAAVIGFHGSAARGIRRLRKLYAERARGDSRGESLE